MKTPIKTRGQSLVEFALLVPILFLMLLFILDVGRAVYGYSVIYNAAREGARYGVIHPDDTTGIQNTVRDYAVGLDPAQLTTTPSQPGDHTIIVKVDYRFMAVTPLLSVFTGSNQLILTSQARMIIEE